MKYCKRCLYPENHPYGILFDSDGVCSGCRVHEEKDNLNWPYRFKKLKKILLDIKEHNKGRGFDCIVPVTGGGDSHFIVHMVKNVLGLEPLLVNYNHHYNTKIGIRNLANLATVFDCDLIKSTHSPDLLRKITHHTIKHYGSMYWHVLAGNSTFPVQVAVKYNIPLIIWGVQGWAEQTGMFSHFDEVEMTERCRKEHSLFGVSAEMLKNSEIIHRDIKGFLYPSDKDIGEVGVRGIYLSNYIRWDSKTQNELMIDLYGYESTLQQRTFNTYEDVHCHHSAGLHDYLKYMKLGYSKATDHACREIRLARMTKEEGIDLVNKYSKVIPKDTKMFLDWCGMSEKDFFSYVVNNRDTKIWSKNVDNEWELKDSIDNHKYDEGIEKFRLNKLENCEFIDTSNGKNFESEDSYLLMGRGYIDKYNFGALDNQPKGMQFKPRNNNNSLID
jgi:N-acetyl sugar amidotransferase